MHKHYGLMATVVETSSLKKKTDGKTHRFSSDTPRRAQTIPIVHVSSSPVLLKTKRVNGIV